MLAQALILAGGFGTRFRAVRDDIPKPLAPVGGKPVLEHQLEDLARAGVEHVVLCVGYLHEKIQQHLGSGERFGLNLRYAVEEQALGTAGAVANARDQLAPGAFAVLNGDTLMPALDYQAFSAHHNQSHAPVSMVVTAPPDAGAYGIIELDADQRKVQGFREKAELGKDFHHRWISAGVYMFDHRIFELIPAGQACSMEEQVFPRVLSEGWAIAAFTYKGFFGDMGTPAGYARTDIFLSSQQEVR